MRILFVNHTSYWAGATISCFYLMTNLSDNFVPIFATREKGAIVEYLEKSGIRSYIIEKKGFLGLVYIYRFLKILKCEKVNLIHLNTLTPFCKYAGIAGFLRRIPIVWVVRENPMISRSRRLRFWLKFLSSKIVFVDSETREKLLPDRRSNAEIIYNGVDVETFRPYKSDFLFKRFNIDPGVRLIGYIGQITKRKGLEYLIKALPMIKERYDKFKLIMIGGYKTNDEAYYLEIKELIKELKLESDIYFTGELPDVKRSLNSLDIVVLPSLEERCSRSLLESLACAKAIVATRVGGTPEIIEDEITGILVEPMNERQIAEAVLRLLSDDELRQKMGINGRIKAENIFDIRGNIKRMRELYSNLNKTVGSYQAN